VEVEIIGAGIVEKKPLLVMFASGKYETKLCNVFGHQLVKHDGLKQNKYGRVPWTAAVTASPCISSLDFAESPNLLVNCPKAAPPLVPPAEHQEVGVT